MPIISKIGSRSAKVRLVYACIYVVLTVGALTMVYPFLLMLAGSTKSEADIHLITPYPEFWFSDEVLFRKYAESKYNVWLDNCRSTWDDPAQSWRRVAVPRPVAESVLTAFRQWRASVPLGRLAFLGHTSGQDGRVLPINARLYRAYVRRLFNRDLEAFRRESKSFAVTWFNVFPTPEIPGNGRYWTGDRSSPANRFFLDYCATRPAADFVILNPEGEYVRIYLAAKYTNSIEKYNQSQGTAYASYEDVRLTAEAPANPPERRDWEAFVRSRLFLAFIVLDPSLAPAYRAHLTARYPTIAEYNKAHHTQYAAFADVPFPAILDENPDVMVDWEAFIKDATLCPVTGLRVRAPSHLFAEFAAARGLAARDLPAFGRVLAAADLADCLEQSRDLRWELTTRNYKQVLEFIALHGNGLTNTLIYCTLAVLTALLVNPLAAYALSRFRLPSTYKILLFCMATMAFPGEVTMIPAFILLKHFPLLPILAAMGVTVAVFPLLERLLRPRRDTVAMLAALAVGALAGGVLLPHLLPGWRTTSLLNTFAALILPGMASGYSIFLLKGFFDSQPRELYEAADIDGASEWVKFWHLTIRLSSPILAVIALGAFLSAYSAFMMALIIIPDEKMWTLMVWIFQLQSWSTLPGVYASLVIAAIPTFIVFVFCQNIIIRGIVVPTEK